MAALNITKDNFDSEVLKSDKLVMVDFWAAWCGPCRMLSPIIEEIAGETEDVKICKINVDEQPELAAKYNVMTIPTVIVIKNGQAVGTSVGVKPKAALLDMLKV